MTDHLCATLQRNALPMRMMIRPAGRAPAGPADDLRRRFARETPACAEPDRCRRHAATARRTRCRGRLRFGQHDWMTDMAPEALRSLVARPSCSTWMGSCSTRNTSHAGPAAGRGGDRDSISRRLCALMIGVPADGCRRLLLEHYGEGRPPTPVRGFVAPPARTDRRRRDAASARRVRVAGPTRRAACRTPLRHRPRDKRHITISSGRASCSALTRS